MTKQEKSWILQDFANSAYSIAITTAILPVFFKSVAAKGMESHLSTAYWGYANSISTAIIAILCPLLGIIADHKGKKKKFFTVFTLLGVLSTAMLFFVKEGNWVSCLAIYVVTVIGFSGSNVFYDSFITDVTTDDRMDYISSAGFGYGYIGGAIPFVASVIFISSANKLGLSSTFATQLSFLVTALWWFMFTLPMLKNVQQTHYVELEEHYIKNCFSNILKTLKKVKSNRKVFLFLLAFFFYIDGVHTIISMSTSFGLDIGLTQNTLMIVLIVLQIVAFPCAMIYGKLAEKFSPKIMILVGILTYTFVCFYAVFIKTALDFWILAMLVGSAQGGIQALSRSYFGKIIPKENSAEYYGIYNIFGRVSSVIGPLLVGIIGTLTKNTRYGVLSLVILFIISIFIFLKVEAVQTIEVQITESTNMN